MAETEQITILRLRTEGAESVQDLKDNIKALKQAVNDTKIGTEEYQQALNLLKVNQNALKDAMYATSASLDDIKNSATGTSNTYNGLVHRMAALKEELRNTDIATESGKKRFGELATQIKDVNDKLKNLDEQQGNFQRNVGNYESHWKGLAKGADAFKKGLDSVGKGVGGVKNGFEALSANPAIGTIGILAQVAMRLSAALGENAVMTDAMGKAMDALKPVMDFFHNIIEKLATFLGDIIGKVSSFLGSSGLFDKVIKGVIGVGNAIVQYITAPFKAVVAAIKVFQEEGIKGIGNAARAFGKEVKSGVSFKANYETGQAFAETLIAGAKSKKEDIKTAGQELGKSAKDGILDGLKMSDSEIDKIVFDAYDSLERATEEQNKIIASAEADRLKVIENTASRQKALNEMLTEDDRERASKSYEIQADADRKKLQLLEQFSVDALARGDLDKNIEYEQEIADLSVKIEMDALKERMRIRKQDADDAEKKVKMRKELLKSVASATSSILGSIADMYENDEENSEKNADKIKGLRIASATIDTISGAIGAYMQAVATIPPPAGIIAGALQAAAVTAAGIAQIQQIKKTQIGGNGSSAIPTASAMVAAPTITTEVSNVRSVTSASEEDRLNQMASSQRVYILASDIEASQNQIKTQVAESSF